MPYEFGRYQNQQSARFPAVTDVREKPAEIGQFAQHRIAELLAGFNDKGVAHKQAGSTGWKGERALDGDLLNLGFLQVLGKGDGSTLCSTFNWGDQIRYRYEQNRTIELRVVGPLLRPKRYC